MSHPGCEQEHFSEGSGSLTGQQHFHRAVRDCCLDTGGFSPIAETHLTTDAARQAAADEHAVKMIRWSVN